MLTRREWLAMSIAGLTASGGRPMFADQPGGARTMNWGVQLYTVRDQLTKDAAATLERIAAIGYKELEILQPTLPVVAPIARRLGLTMVSAHLDQKTAAGEGVAAFAAQAKANGVAALVVPYIPVGDRPRDRAGFQKLAERLARMSDEVRGAGLELWYHNHAFEFATDSDGTRWLDVLMQHTAAAQMKLQLDVFWASIAGADPVAMIRKHSARIGSLHLKDKDPKAATVLTESDVARSSFREVGAGALDFRAILAAASSAGVRHYFVEQDYTPGDPIDSLAMSYRYLAALRP